MLCQICNKNEATIHFTTIMNGKAENKYICESCASEYQDENLELPFSLNKLFASFLSGFETEEDFDEKEEKVCDGCGLTYRQLMDKGKFGCDECYDVFYEDIKELLKGIHGHHIHRGKIPKRSGEKTIKIREVEELKEKLDLAVNKEEYEEAAILRDRIKEIKDTINSYGE